MSKDANCQLKSVTGAPLGFRSEDHERATSNKVPRNIFCRAIVIWLRAHSDDAVAQASLQRADGLPFELIERVASRMRLRDEATS